MSIFPIFDLVRRVAGPDADVTLLLPAGRSPVGVEPSPAMAASAKDARLAVMVGLGLDPWAEVVLQDAAPKARLLKVGDRVPTLTVKGQEDKTDPFAWLDPQRARLMVKAIGEDLARVDASHANAYRQRANALDAQLEALDKEIEQASLAWKNRQIVTEEATMGYFAERYKLTVVAVIDPAPSEATSAEQIDRAAKVIASESAKQPPAVLRDAQRAPGPTHLLATRTHAPLGVIDAIGGGGPETDSYEKLLRFDVAELGKVLD